MPIDATNVVSTETAAQLLYGLPPGDFVAARNQLVRDLRASGHREIAAEVKTLRRPTVVAGELNRLLRAAPDQLDRLLAAADELHRAHQMLVDGETVDFATLQARHRSEARALASLAARHRELLEPLLERATLDRSQHDRLRAATFDREPEAAVGFDLVGHRPEPSTPSSPVGSTPSPPAPQPRSGALLARSSPEADGPEPDELEPHEGRRDGAGRPAGASGAPGSEAGNRPTISHVRAAAAHEEALHSQALARRRLDAAATTEQRASARVTELEQRLVEARRHLGESTTKLDEAAAAVARADERVARAAADLARAKAKLAKNPNDHPASQEP